MSYRIGRTNDVRVEKKTPSYETYHLPDLTKAILRGCATRAARKERKRSMKRNVVLKVSRQQTENCPADLENNQSYCCAPRSGRAPSSGSWGNGRRQAQIVNTRSTAPVSLGGCLFAEHCKRTMQRFRHRHRRGTLTKGIGNTIRVDKII